MMDNTPKIIAANRARWDNGDPSVRCGPEHSLGRRRSEVDAFRHCDTETERQCNREKAGQCVRIPVRTWASPEIAACPFALDPRTKKWNDYSPTLSSRPKACPPKLKKKSSLR